ncbi:hypothetical protein BD626DRAFT_408047 [Schizophyllum amplum]|uniref:Transmembrane protein n=1 Tax=Schizophyllum amplum TaxID=97359 RepID=A0A550C5U9_9AGAR|nr:hypothetical protein BD626DRAFT_408047 [Auriculariopsis ampla]
MPSQNFTIDNTSPLITYKPEGQWSQGSAALDSSADLYSDGGTFTLTNTSGSKASFSFNGTDVYVYGAKRGNHGQYTVALDGSSNTFDGYSKPDEFQVALFTAGSLSTNKMHTVTITCEDDAYFDIDFITWTADIGKDTAPSQTTIQDTSSELSYSGAWTTNSDDIPSLSSFNGGTAHQTRDGDSYVTLNFSGQAVDLYGGVGPSRGPYTVQLDGGDVQTFNATNANVQTQVMLYHGDNLGGGKHNMIITNQPGRTGDGLVIDYAVYYASDDGSDATDGSNASGLSTGAIVGIVVGVVGGLAVLALAVFFILRRRRKNRDEGGIWTDKPGSPIPPAQPYVYSPAPGSDHNAYAASTYPSYTQALPPPKLAGTITPSHGSQLNVSNQWPDESSTSAGGSSVYRPGVAQAYSSQGAPGLHTANPSEVGDGPSMPVPVTGSSRPGKQMGAAVPAAQRQAPSPQLTPEELAHQRLMVDGREQDFGPLPPNYDQATQPFSR